MLTGLPAADADELAELRANQQLIQRLDEPLVYDLLRLVPSAAVSTSGPAGSFTDVRIRGAEANHTLLFIDGIRANDPASGDQPRFDLLNAEKAHVAFDFAVPHERAALRTLVTNADVVLKALG